MPVMDLLRRGIAEANSLAAHSTQRLEMRGGTPTEATDPTNTIAPFHTSLNGVNQPMNMLFKEILWWCLGGAAIFVLLVRIFGLSWASLRKVSTLTVPGHQQEYWKYAQWSWTPSLKKYITYAPLWKKRHNKEICLSSAVSVGTLPSRLHFTLLFLYLGSNIAYMFVLNWSQKNKYEFCAELRGRSGTLALVNMIPLIIFAGRNNPLIALLRISFDTYNLLHRWMGRIVVIESIIHTIAWLIVCVADIGWSGVGQQLKERAFIRSGFVGTIAMTLLLLLSVSPLRHAFYETFLNVHIILAFTAFVATWVHCASSNLPGPLPQLPWIIAIMALWFADRFARMLRVVYINRAAKGFTDATCEALPGEVTRVTIHFRHYLNIKPGTHAYLRFKGLNTWENHPFSICWAEHHGPNDYHGSSDTLPEPPGTSDSLPIYEEKARTTFDPRLARTSVAFLIKAQTGMTRKLWDRASTVDQPMPIKVAMEGPYDGHHSIDSYGHTVLFAGSSGITHQISYVRHLLEGYNRSRVSTRRITLVWIIRDSEALEWIQPYMETIYQIPHQEEILRVQVYVTKPKSPHNITSASSSPTVSILPGRPDISVVLEREVAEQMGAMCVTVCGPGGLADDVRCAVRSVQGPTVVDFVEQSFTW